MRSKEEVEPRPETPQRSTRRDFVAKASYAAPVLLSLPAIPAFAQSGSAGGGSGGSDPGGPVDCIAQYDTFFANSGYPYNSFQEFSDAANAQGITPEILAAQQDFLDAFNDGVCLIS